MSLMAIITGGSRSIGTATARLAAEAGYDVCLNYALDAKAAQKIALECESKGRWAGAVQADGTDSTNSTRLFHACDERLGPLLDNVGIIGQATTVANLTDDTLTRTFTVNSYGSVFCPRAAIKRMAKSAGGSGAVIENNSSVAVQLGTPSEYMHYTASKAAIENFTIGQTKEVGTNNTNIHAMAGNLNRPATVTANAPLRRLTTLKDIVNGIMWLVSAPADYVNGAVLPVSDGL
jgi:NAD(P)-dependent dehydrogenase (short-subunit alcohol dehydrogenase family)